MSENSPESPGNSEISIAVDETNPNGGVTNDGDPHVTRRHRRRHRRRRHQHRHDRHAKSILRFGTTHIILGIICVTLQMIQFTNNSILSESQPGLWSGTFFVITGSVCLGLAKTYGIYSTLAMLSFCLVSLFMALTLASLSWMGAEEASNCEFIWHQCHDNKSTTTTTTITSTTPYSLKLDADEDAGANKLFDEQECFNLQAICGYNISLSRSLHSLLILLGVVSSTTSFILATLVCSRPAQRSSSGRVHSIFAISGSSDQPVSTRPITAWEFPPPIKNPLPASDSLYPDEDPPPYEDEIVDSSYM